MEVSNVYCKITSYNALAQTLKKINFLCVLLLVQPTSRHKFDSENLLGQMSTGNYTTTLTNYICNDGGSVLATRALSQ